MACDDEYGLSAVADVERAKNGRHVNLDGTFRQTKQIGDLTVGFTLSQQFHDPRLRGGEPKALLHGRAAAPSRRAARRLFGRIDTTVEHDANGFEKLFA